MATKKTQPASEAHAHHPEGTLEKAATAIGSALGTVVAKTGLGDHHGSEKPRVVKGKFQKSGRQRLPRKLKKISRRKTAA